MLGDIAVSVLVSPVIAIMGWFVANNHATKRDRRNKQRDIRVQYLINAYRHLEAIASRGSDIDRYADNFESAIADIQLFGCPLQVQMAQELATSIASRSQDSSTGPLLLALRDDLRRELGLEKVGVEPVHLRIKRSG